MGSFGRRPSRALPPHQQRDRHLRAPARRPDRRFRRFASMPGSATSTETVSRTSLSASTSRRPPLMIFFGSGDRPRRGRHVPRCPSLASRLIAIDLERRRAGRDPRGVLRAGRAALTSRSRRPASSADATQTILAGVRQLELKPGPDVVEDFDQDGDRATSVAMISNRPALFMNDAPARFVQISGRIKGYTIGRLPARGRRRRRRRPRSPRMDWELGRLRRRDDAERRRRVLHNRSDLADRRAGQSSESPLLLHAFDKDGDGDVDLYGARNMYELGRHRPWHRRRARKRRRCLHGRFHARRQRPVGGHRRTLDVDGDGDRDIVLGRRGSPSFGNGVALPMRLVVNDGAAGIRGGGSDRRQPRHLRPRDRRLRRRWTRTDIFQTNRNVIAGPDRHAVHPLRAAPERRLGRVHVEPPAR